MSDHDNMLEMSLKSGKVTIRLRPDLAPLAVARLKELSSQGFYDGVKFHRVIEGFMAQGGRPDRHRLGRERSARLKGGIHAGGEV